MRDIVHKKYRLESARNKQITIAASIERLRGLVDEETLQELKDELVVAKQATNDAITALAIAIAIHTTDDSMVHLLRGA